MLEKYTAFAVLFLTNTNFYFYEAASCNYKMNAQKYSIATVCLVYLV